MSANFIIERLDKLNVNCDADVNNAKEPSLSGSFRTRTKQHISLLCASLQNKTHTLGTRPKCVVMDMNQGPARPLFLPSQRTRF